VVGSPIRRVALVLVGYAATGWLVFHFGGWLRRVLVLPPLFDELLRVGLVVGVPIAAVLAWYYPRLGHGSTAVDDGPPGGAGEA